MRYQIRRANKFDFEVVYRLICQLVETKPGTISTKALKDICLENLHARNKEHYIVEYAGDAVGFIRLEMPIALKRLVSFGGNGFLNFVHKRMATASVRSGN